ncbi:cysteine desulfurase [Candidatus Parcubacteria bacterium]|nr:cysteine desulfurase [Candidatus Parcubacteria bacterium]
MQSRVFLDYASTTPLDPKVLKAMLPFMAADFGNPSAIYNEGLKAKNAVREARTSIARHLNIRPEEIIFTASGTEADNLAIAGVVNAWKKSFIPHIVTTNIEHPGILELCKHFEKEEVEVTYVPVEENGIVDPQKIKQALKPTTVLVSVMYANNEIGTIQPLREISRIIQEFKKTQYVALPYFHTDASQAANYVDLSFQKLGVDMMTLDASKIYGPKGVGFLASKRGVSLVPLIFGGGQERGLRSGTENVPGIVGMAKALDITQSIKEKESKRLRNLQQYFFDGVIKISPRVSSNGDLEKRLPNNVNICIDGIDSEFAVIKLDTEGISCSSASSCINLSEEPYSYVIDALGKSGRACRSSSLRFTFGRATKKQDLNLTLLKIKTILITQ